MLFSNYERNLNSLSQKAANAKKKKKKRNPNFNFYSYFLVLQQNFVNLTD